MDGSLGVTVLARGLRQTIETLVNQHTVERQTNQNAVFHLETEGNRLKQKLKEQQLQLAKSQYEGRTSNVLVMTKHGDKDWR